MTIDKKDILILQEFEIQILYKFLKLKEDRVSHQIRKIIEKIESHLYERMTIDEVEHLLNDRAEYEERYD